MLMTTTMKTMKKRRMTRTRMTRRQAKATARRHS
jgi:hypothetical protein